MGGRRTLLTWTTTSPRRSFSRLPWTPRRRRHWRGVTTGWSSRRRRGHEPPAYRRLWCVFELALASAQSGEFARDGTDGRQNWGIPSTPTRAGKPEAAPPGFDLALVRSEEADLVRSFSTAQDAVFEWIGGIDSSKAAATDKLDETLLREFAEKKFPGGYRLLDAAARDAAAAALAAACEHNLRGAIEAEDVASECDMRGALGRLHAYRRMDEDAAREFKAEADDPRRRGGEGSHGSRGGPG